RAESAIGPVNAPRPDRPRVPSTAATRARPAPAHVGRDGRALRKRNENLPADSTSGADSRALFAAAIVAKSARRLRRRLAHLVTGSSPAPSAVRGRLGGGRAS